MSFMKFREKKAEINPLDPKLFQSRGNCELWRLKVPMNSKLGEVVPFTGAEIATVKKAADKHPEVDFSNFALSYTTKSPATAQELAGVTADMIFLVSAQKAKENAKGEDAQKADLKEQLQKILADYKVLLAEKVKLEFLTLEIEKIGKLLEKLETGAGVDFLQTKAQENVDWFEKLIKDYTTITKEMFDSGMGGTAIYKKLEVDWRYLRRMKGFIIQKVRNVQSKREMEEENCSVIVRIFKNFVNALEKTDTAGLYGKFAKFIKIAGGSVIIGGGTLGVAKTEVLDFLGEISKMPDLIYVIGMMGAAVGGFVIFGAGEIIKAYKKNSFMKKSEKRINKAIDRILEWTDRNIAAVVLKAHKEMMKAGYIEELQGEVSSEFLAAAYQGDFDAAKKIYHKKVDSLLSKRTFGSVLRNAMNSVLRRKADADSAIRDAEEVDGFYVNNYSEKADDTDLGHA